MAGVRITSARCALKHGPSRLPGARARRAVDAGHRQRWQGPDGFAPRLAAETRALTRKILLRLFRLSRAACLARDAEPRFQPTARPACPCCRRHMPSLSDDAGLCERRDEMRRRPADPGLSARPRGAARRPGAGVAPSDPRYGDARSARQVLAEVRQGLGQPIAPAGRPRHDAGFPERARFQDLAAEVGGIHAMPGHGLESRLDLGNGEFVVQQMRDDGRIGRLRAQCAASAIRRLWSNASAGSASISCSVMRPSSASGCSASAACSARYTTDADQPRGSRAGRTRCRPAPGPARSPASRAARGGRSGPYRRLRRRAHSRLARPTGLNGPPRARATCRR